MQQLIVLKLGQGNWQRGFPTVTVQWVTVSPTATTPIVPTQWVGSLPAAPAIANLYDQWRSLHQALNQRLNLRRGAIEIEDEGITNVSPTALEQLSHQLKPALDRWLEAETFRKIDRRLRTHLTPHDEIRVVVETEDPLLRRFPWHLWSFFEDYPLAEVALSVAEYGQVNRVLRQPTGKVRILAVLGNSEGIDVQHDRALLEALPQTEIDFLVEPTRAELDQHLWATQGWDILFFGGHSSSQADGSTGELAINPQENLTIAQLKNALKAAINRGLQIAIFNSCDGLGLARAMADLNIPQLIVMREPVPDRVAQTFLTQFLAAFAGGQSFYPAVREARERLQGLESEFPCASWLPVICQNPAEVPLDWQSLSGSLPPSPLSPAPPLSPVRTNSPSISFKLAALTSLVATGLVMGMRWLGGLQGIELRAYDQLLRLRPAEVADSRILVVEVTQEDTNQYGYPLQDKTLAAAIDKVAQMQPRAIGVDMHRYQPRGEGRSDLMRQFQQHPNLLTVCWFGSTDKNFAPPPEFSNTQRLSQVGFSDLLLDGNVASADPAGGIVRRQMLSYDPKVADSPPDCATPYSFSFQLAFKYLYAEGVKPLEVNANGEWQFGPVTFSRLPARFVAYQDLDGLSSQVMINYRRAAPGQRVTLDQVLQGKVDRNFVENRIVLMGTTAPIARDSFFTPDGEMAGIWVHAHQVSQMLSAVQNQRPLIWGLPQWADAMWIWVWAAIGAGITWRWSTKRWWLVAIGLALVGLYQICWFLLLKGGWLAIVPAALALVLASTLVQLFRRGGIQLPSIQHKP